MSTARTHPRIRRGGFTLVEAVMAMVISVLILGTLESLILVAGKATPSDSSAGTVALKSTANLDYLATDLACANAFVTLSPNTVEFYLPDRDGDGNPDLVKYQWSGVAGEPLYRSYTGSDANAYDTASAVVPAVKTLSFLPSIRTTNTTTTSSGAALGTGTTSEKLYDSYQSAANPSTVNITSTSQLGQVFVPTLPSGATSYRVTRLSLRLAYASPASGYFDVAIRKASGGAPTSTIMCKATIAESSLGPGVAWTDISFPNCPDLSPTQAYSFTITWNADTAATKVSLKSTGAGNANSRYCTSTSGSVWAVSSSGSIFYRLYGVATVPGGSVTPVTTTITSTTVDGIDVRLTPSAPGSKSIDVFFPALNHPDSP